MQLQIFDAAVRSIKKLVRPEQMVRDLPNLKVYVIHVKALSNRKSLCDKLRQDLEKDPEFNLESFEYITKNDPGEPLDPINVDLQPIPNDGTGIDRFNTFIRPFKIAHVTNALKHKCALESIASSTNTINTIHMVIEDDALKQSVDNGALKKSMASFYNNNVPVMFLGIPPGVMANNNGMQPVSDVYTALPCCDSYFIAPMAAKAMLEHIRTLKFPTHIQLTYALVKANIVPFMSAPAVFVDGSKLGVFMSTIDSNNRLIFNGGFVEIAKALQDKDVLPEDKMEQVFSKAEPKWHPEFKHMRALYEQKRGNYEMAEKYYTEALNQYTAFGGIIDNHTELLRDFMRLYRHLQRLP
jgi:formaldehyde-activating enzyme involved in methanogenesis